METRAYLVFYRDIKKLSQHGEIDDNAVVKICFHDNGAMMMTESNGEWRKIDDFPYLSFVLLQHLLSQKATFVIINAAKKMSVYPCGCYNIDGNQYIYCDLHKLAQKLS